MQLLKLWDKTPHWDFSTALLILTGLKYIYIHFLINLVKRCAIKPYRNPKTDFCLGIYRNFGHPCKCPVLPFRSNFICHLKKKINSTTTCVWLELYLDQLAPQLCKGQKWWLLGSYHMYCFKVCSSRSLQERKQVLSALAIKECSATIVADVHWSRNIHPHRSIKPDMIQSTLVGWHSKRASLPRTAP